MGHSAPSVPTVGQIGGDITNAGKQVGQLFNNTVNDAGLSGATGLAAGLAAGPFGFPLAAKSIGDIYGSLTATPPVQTPPAPPTVGGANLAALGNQLSYEQRAAASNTILGTPASGGLLSQPTTASRILLGS